MSDAVHKLMRQAWQKMYGHTCFYSSDHFIAGCINFLSFRWEDFHLEYMKGEGWSVSCCYQKWTWGKQASGETMVEALAKAALDFGDFDRSLELELNAWEAGSDDAFSDWATEGEDVYTMDDGKPLGEPDAE